jgi:homoserine O-acetyltransferase/O-succinyltransferase
MATDRGAVAVHGACQTKEDLAIETARNDTLGHDNGLSPVSAPTIPPCDIFTARDFPLACGAVLPEARLAFRQQGRIGQGLPVLTLSAFGATSADLGYLAMPGGPLDPARHWLIQMEQLGNGRSSSPSNTPVPFDGADFPAVSHQDNQRLQSLLLDHLGISRVKAAIGASMGAQQALQWAATEPERIGGVVAIAGDARTSFYAKLFLHAVASALRSDPAFAGGRYTAPPLTGLTRMSEAWAAFALSSEFFNTSRHKAHVDTEAGDVSAFLAKWGTRYHARDANDLLLQLAAWDAHDIGTAPGAAGSSERAAARAMMPVLFLPIDTDAYFTAPEVKRQAMAFPDATVEVIRSLSGHAAAFGREAEDRAAISAAIVRFLAESAPET